MIQVILRYCYGLVLIIRRCIFCRVLFRRIFILSMCSGCKDICLCLKIIKRLEKLSAISACLCFISHCKLCISHCHASSITISCAHPNAYMIHNATLASDIQLDFNAPSAIYAVACWFGLHATFSLPPRYL